MNEYVKIFKALSEEKVKYLVVGGIAVNLYGYERFTKDIDILLALDKKNLEKMGKVIKKLGYIERLPIKLQDLSNKQQVKKWLKQKGMTAFTFLSEKRVALDIDILVNNSLSFKKFYDKRSVIGIWDIKLPVISLNDLLKMKKAAGRDQDLVDLKKLLEYKGS